MAAQSMKGIRNWAESSFPNHPGSQNQDDNSQPEMEIVKRRANSFAVLLKVTKNEWFDDLNISSSLASGVEEKRLFINR